jgi:uncharacterized protein YjbJ (UPF0337 family)
MLVTECGGERKAFIMGEWTDQIEGKAKEAAGTVTGDDSTKNEGKAQSTVGNVEGKANSIKDGISNAADEFTGNNDNSNR